MKRLSTSLPFLAEQARRKGILSLLGSVFCFMLAFGQQANITQEFGDLSGTTWKPSADLNNALTSERAKMDVMLAAPGLPLTDRSLFLSYQRLVDYLQTDIQAGNPVEVALVKNFERVLEEAPKDPDLKHLPINSLTTLLPGLLEALTEVPLPVMGQ